MIIYAGNRGYLDEFPVNRIREYEQKLYEFMDKEHPDILEKIAERKSIDCGARRGHGRGAPGIQPAVQERGSDVPALIDLRRRIRSVRNTQQITQAMKTVSTAKFKKAQRSVLEGRPLWHNLPGLLERVAAWAGRQVSPLLDVRDENKLLAVVITSDKGLCGAFNSNLLARAEAFLEEKTPAEASLVLVGKKAVNHFLKKSYPVLRAYGEKADKLSVRELKEIAHLLRGQYVFSRTDSVYIIYNEFKSILAPRVTVARVLPVPSPERAGRR